MDTFFNILKLYWMNICNFKGRSTREEFWIPVLFMEFVLFVLSGLSLGLILKLFFIANLIAFISVGIRRLHDCGKSGHLLWIAPLCLMTFLFICAFVFAVFSYFDITNSIIQSIRSVIFILGGFLLVSSIPLILFIYGLVPSEKKDNKYGPYIAIKKD